MAQQVKDLASSLLWLGSLLCCRFDPWPGNFHVPQVQEKKKKTKEKKSYTKIYVGFFFNLNHKTCNNIQP